MDFFDVLQLILNAACGMVPDYIGGGVEILDGRCPAAAFTAVGAAFSTIGYWVQADLLYYLTRTDFGLWAPMLYIGAAFAGMMSVAMGMPSKTYMWFFIGPALYAWLLDTTVDVTGVEWVVAGVPQDQTRVWRLAETGLVNTNVKHRQSLDVSGKGPPDDVTVAFFFAWFDELVSHSVQWLVRWSGIGWLARGSGYADSNIMQPPNNIADSKWYLLTNSKWGFLDSITQAQLGSPDVRDSFINFTSSECGDALKESIDEASFIAASNSAGNHTPESVFQDDGYGQDYALLSRKLRTTFVPFPRSLKRFLKVEGKKSFKETLNWGNKNELFEHPSDPNKGLINLEKLRCDLFLELLVLAFRWESGHLYYQIFAGAANGMDPENTADVMTPFQIIYSFLYGWAVRDKDDKLLGFSGGGLSNGEARYRLNAFMKHLIFVHMIRNEVALAKQPINLRYTSGNQTRQVVDEYQRTLGQKTKYGELYTWALLVPYLQGILMYLLAMAYPFACVAMVVPGWHTVLVTWATFWIWVKLWDVGFAVVMSLERTLWAMIGNSVKAEKMLKQIVKMQEDTGRASSAITCQDPNGPTIDNPLGCQVPFVFLLESYASGNLSDAALTPGPTSWAANLRLFDSALCLGPHMTLDLSNGYYIYIIAAMYFAVPAVTGQLVLGAHSGASSMVGSAIGGVSSEAGRAGGEAFKGNQAAKVKANQSGMMQTELAKAHRSSGLAHQALKSSTKGADYGMDSGKLGVMGQGESAMASMSELGKSRTDANRNVLFQGGKALQNRFDDGARQTGTATGDGTGSGTRKGGLSSWGSGKLSEMSGGDALSAQMNSVGKGGGAGAMVSPDYKSAMSKLKGLAGDFATDFAKAAGDREALLAYQDAAANAQAAQMSNAISGFGAGQKSSGYEQHAGQLSAHAEHEAQMAAWEAMNQYSMGLSAKATGAWGLWAGALDPGQKPSEVKGMGMAGMLNGMDKSGRYRDVKGLSNYYNPSQRGGFMDRVDSQAGGLHAQYGSRAVLNRYKQTGGGSAANELTKSWGAGARFIGDVFKGS